MNFKKVSKKVYQNILLRKGINTNSPNYAIWQGEIDRLILKDPMQLTALLENLSGSIYYKKNYDDLKQQLSDLQAAMEEKTRRFNKLKMDKKNLKVLKSTNEEYQKYENQYNQILSKIYYFNLLQK
jgi:structural maintenance of chromosome 1